VRASERKRLILLVNSQYEFPNFLASVYCSNLSNSLHSKTKMKGNHYDDNRRKYSWIDKKMIGEFITEYKCD
jgi:hypothetical protein